MLQFVKILKFVHMYTFFLCNNTKQNQLELTELTLQSRTQGQNRGGRRGRLILCFKIFLYG